MAFRGFPNESHFEGSRWASHAADLTHFNHNSTERWPRQSEEVYLSPSVRLKAVVLHGWVIRIIDEGDVCVEGFRCDRPGWPVWHTTQIEERLVPSLLRTQKGTVYRLQGPMDNEYASRLGYPSWLKAAFRDGFPDNWRELVKELLRMDGGRCDTSQWYESLAEARPMGPSATGVWDRDSLGLVEAVEEMAREKNLPPARKSIRASFLPPLDPLTEGSGDDSPAPSTSNSATKRQKTRSSPRLRKSAENRQKDNSLTTEKEKLLSGTSKKKKKSVEAVEGEACGPKIKAKSSQGVDASPDEGVFKRPALPPKPAALKPKQKSSAAKKKPSAELNLSIEQQTMYKKMKNFGLDKDLKVSRSGRLLKPPLASYAGQRIRYDVHGNVIGVSEGTTQLKRPFGRSGLDVSELGSFLDVAVSPAHQSEMKQKKRVVVYDSSSDEHSEPSPSPVKKAKPKRRISSSASSASPTPSPKKSLARVPKPKKPPSTEVLVLQKAPDKPKPPVPKRWTNELRQHLKIAFEAIAPRSEADWEKVAKSLGAGRTGEMCRKEAEKFFGYSMMMEAPDQPTRHYAEQLMQSRPGTLEYKMRAQKFMDSYVRSEQPSDDFFESALAPVDDSMMPSLAMLSPNLLKALETPKLAGGAERRYIPPRISEELTPASQKWTTPAISAADKKRELRYIHQLEKGAREQRRVGGRAEKGVSGPGRKKGKREFDRHVEEVRAAMAKMERAQKKNHRRELLQDPDVSIEDPYFSSDSSLSP